MKAITAEDLRALWQAALHSGKRDFAIITLIATSGVRAGELVSMNLRQLDLRQGLAWVNGKRGWRKVFLGKASVEAILAYLPERPTNGGDALWLNVKGRPLTTDGIRQLVDRLAIEANVTGRHNLHAFRHRAAQSWLNRGINAQIVAKALGHRASSGCRWPWTQRRGLPASRRRARRGSGASACACERRCKLCGPSAPCPSSP
ncbi:MAG: tyrosine-type recombinase/integrase [Chloroflexi bacterium]|nr:tyrosine-type recombinase/integrase [Chloroflexota bacterium]